MSNMAYCRFQNTVKDLSACLNSLDCGDDLSEEEEAAKKRLVKICKKIAEYDEEE